MNKKAISLACAFALAPLAAHAAKYTDSDSLSFVAGSSPFAVLFKWTDAFSTKTSSKGVTSTDEANGVYSWVLTDSTHLVVDQSTKIGFPTSGDKDGVLSGSFGHTFLGLTAGQSYTLSFTGKWTGVSNGAKWTVSSPDVSIGAVPEPETYAMLIAGLGLIGSIIRRRKRG